MVCYLKIHTIYFNQKEAKKLTQNTNGAVGTGGTQALDVIAHNQDKFKVTALSCAKSLPLLCRQIEEFSPEAVAVRDEADAKELADKYKKLEIFWGAEGLLSGTYSIYCFTHCEYNSRNRSERIY